MYKSKEPKQAEIRRKIEQSGIKSPEEFEEIISNLITQRERLETDLAQLREKVVALQEKQAQKQFTRTIRKRISPSKKQINYREQLSKKYEQLKQWQRRSLKAMKNTPVEIEYKAYFDKLYCVEQQIQSTLKQLNDEYATSKKLKKALKLINKDEQINNNAHEGIERENKLLKKRLFSLRKIVDRQLDKELELHNYLIDIKDKERQNRMKERDVISRQQRMSRELREIKKMKTEGNRPSRTQQVSESEDDEIVDFPLHPNQIVSREEVYQVEGRLNRIENKLRNQMYEIEGRIKKNYPNEALKQRREGSKLTFAKEFEILLEKLKINLNRLNQLNKNKIKLFFLTMDKNGSEEQKSQISSSSSLLKGLRGNLASKQRLTGQIDGRSSPFQKRPRVESVTLTQQRFQGKVLYPRAIAICDEHSSQTEGFQYFAFTGLRRDFIGQIDEHCFFDRNILGSQRNCSIKTLQIYYSNRGIATIRALYRNHQKESFKQSESIVPGNFINNYCKVHVIDTANDDFIRYFKLRYHTLDNRITQIKIVTNRGVKSGWGDSKIKGEELDRDEEIEKEMVLDINEDEYPVSIFCSHLQKGPYWYLCGFGVEVNEL